MCQKILPVSLVDTLIIGLRSKQSMCFFLLCSWSPINWYLLVQLCPSKPPPHTVCHMDAFKGFLPWKDQAQLTGKGWPWGIHRINWGAMPCNDMDTIWNISIFWIYLLLMSSLWGETSGLWLVYAGSAHGCPCWDWTTWISTTSLDPDHSWLPFGTHLFPQFKVLEVRCRLHYIPQGNNLYNHSQFPLRRN